MCLNVIRNYFTFHFRTIDYCIWQLRNAVYGSMFFECKKAENIQEMNKNLHIFGLFITWDIKLLPPLLEEQAFPLLPFLNP
jgi:ribosomal protein S6